MGKAIGVKTIQGPPLNCELVSSSYLLIVQNMLSTERIEVLLSIFALDNSSGPPHNRVPIVEPFYFCPC